MSIPFLPFPLTKITSLQLLFKSCSWWNQLFERQSVLSCDVVKGIKIVSEVSRENIKKRLKFVSLSFIQISAKKKKKKEEKESFFMHPEMSFSGSMPPWWSSDCTLRMATWLIARQHHTWHTGPSLHLPQPEHTCEHLAWLLRQIRGPTAFFFFFLRIYLL